MLASGFKSWAGLAFSLAPKVLSSLYEPLSSNLLNRKRGGVKKTTFFPRGMDEDRSKTQHP